MSIKNSKRVVEGFLSIPCFYFPCALSLFIQSKQKIIFFLLPLLHNLPFTEKKTKFFVFRSDVDGLLPLIYDVQTSIGNCYTRRRERASGTECICFFLHSPSHSLTLTHSVKNSFLGVKKFCRGHTTHKNCKVFIDGWI